MHEDDPPLQRGHAEFRETAPIDPGRGDGGGGEPPPPPTDERWRGDRYRPPRKKPLLGLVVFALMLLLSGFVGWAIGAAREFIERAEAA